MDESLRVTIATLSGFIIAFFAEPIKIYFQQRAKKKNLRRALYHEIYYNYNRIAGYFDERKDREVTSRDMYQFVEGVKHIARLEAYQYYITHDMDLFYQLKEVAKINSLYADLNLLLENAQIRVQQKKPFDSTVQHIRGFLRRYVEAVSTERLDKNLLRDIIGQDELDSLLKKKY